MKMGLEKRKGLDFGLPWEYPVTLSYDVVFT